MNAPLSRPSDRTCKKRRLGFTGMTWLWIILGLFFLTGGVMSAFFKKNNFRPRGVPTINAPRSWVGVDDFNTTDEGVTFESIDAEDGPADKAGLVGGDIITSFDGQIVRSESQMMDLLRRTTIGKTVDVIYLRDGVSHTTKLTTVSEEDYNRLRDVGDRPQGMLGFEDRRTTPVRNPETKTFGLRLDWVRPNGPADLFGLKEGDIITEFDKVPIRTGKELAARVHRTSPRSVVEVTIIRDGQTLKIPVTLGRA